jgi:hypothetical protein
MKDKKTKKSKNKVRVRAIINCKLHTITSINKRLRDALFISVMGTTLANVIHQNCKSA